MISTFSLDELVEKARALADTGQRKILGIAGAPGSGKTTISQAILKGLTPGSVVVAPMDGFHFSNATLINWKRRDRKGAWDTFDADGYVNLLQRIKGQKDLVIHAPDFDRDIDESIGSAIPIYPKTSLVIAEGTFLLSQQGNWPQVLPLLDQSWFVQLEDEVRHERLIKRHNKHGMSIEEAKSWTLNTDEKNAQMVKTDHARATLSFKVI
jgi:pantothenate kinase